MEFYELFEHVPEDFNIFSGDGILMNDGQINRLVEQKYLREHLEMGWQIGKLKGNVNV